MNLGFVIQQVFFSLLGSNIIVQAVEEILFVVIILLAKAVNDTKQGFCLFLQSAEHYVSCKERKHTGFLQELQSCLLAGCSQEVYMQILHPVMVFLNEPLVFHSCATIPITNRNK